MEGRTHITPAHIPTLKIEENYQFEPFLRVFPCILSLKGTTMRFLNQSSLSKAKSEILDFCAFKVLVLRTLVRRYTLYKWIRAYFLLRTEEVPTIQASGGNTFFVFIFLFTSVQTFRSKIHENETLYLFPFCSHLKPIQVGEFYVCFPYLFSFFLVAIYHTVMLSCYSSANRLYSSSFQMLVLYFF